ncbi:hypothetical protein JG688_00018069 [Phytophthora aleatoria]|uniref:Protein argonaute N-terminal domain-containing protein n=1 Tax=Phytophthora aleatoria TaxID=2496075 RepID=A0A8J5IGK2_9STRA|nr:hypothetical protein JG688_00018069 [Phytophthora aleatoria]
MSSNEGGAYGSGCNEYIRGENNYGRSRTKVESLVTATEDMIKVRAATFKIKDTATTAIARVMAAPPGMKVAPRGTATQDTITDAVTTVKIDDTATLDVVGTTTAPVRMAAIVITRTQGTVDERSSEATVDGLLAANIMVMTMAVVGVIVEKIAATVEKIEMIEAMAACRIGAVVEVEVAIADVTSVATADKEAIAAPTVVEEKIVAMVIVEAEAMMVEIATEADTEDEAEVADVEAAALREKKDLVQVLSLALVRSDDPDLHKEVQICRRPGAVRSGRTVSVNVNYFKVSVENAPREIFKYHVTVERSSDIVADARYGAADAEQKTEDAAINSAPRHEPRPERPLPRSLVGTVINATLHQYREAFEGARVAHDAMASLYSPVKLSWNSKEFADVDPDNTDAARDSRLQVASSQDGNTGARVNKFQTFMVKMKLVEVLSMTTLKNYYSNPIVNVLPVLQALDVVARHLATQRFVTVGSELYNMKDKLKPRNVLSSSSKSSDDSVPLSSVNQVWESSSSGEECIAIAVAPTANVGSIVVERRVLIRLTGLPLMTSLPCCEASMLS